MDFYVYAHKIPKTGEIFYIGKGRMRRAWAKNGRNPFWKNIALKHGYSVEILIDKLSEEHAYLQEALGIMEICPRANFGHIGIRNKSEFVTKRWATLTEDQRQTVRLSISNSLKGRKLSPEHAEKARKALEIGRLKKDKESLKKAGISISKALKGKKKSKDQIDRIKKLRIGTKHSDLSNLKRSISMGAKEFEVFDKKGNFKGSWINKEECARVLNLDGSRINNCLNKKRKSHKGLIFNYKENF